VLAFVDWLAVPAYSKNQDLAVEWLKYTFSKENNNKWNETMGLIPARTDAQYGFVEDNPVLKKEAAIASADSYGYAGIIEPTKLQDILQTQLGLYLTDQQDLETTQSNIQSQYADVVASAGK
jgi:multiple sugar transport system substrate-binding protein